MWKIKQIFDGDYGCEELAEGQTPRVSVMLVDEAGAKKYITVEDMIKNILLEENMSILKLGKNIKEEVLKDYSFEKMEVFINNTNDENLNNIFLYLHPNYRLEH